MTALVAPSWLLAGLAVVGTAALGMTRLRGRVVDALGGEPVAGARVTTARGGAAVTGANGRFALEGRPGDTIRVRRVGYAPARAVLHAGLTVVRLVPAAVRLAPVRVTAARAPIARVSITQTTRRLRRDGVLSLGGALSRFPGVSARSGRDGVVLSLRGARPEQVLVLFDGVPLNDPATGVAHLGDIPLAMLGAVTVTPGAGTSTAGSGASGGVVSLAGGSAPVLTMWTGSFGRIGASGAAVWRAGDATVRAGGEWAYARNDFPFLDTVHRPDTAERRVDADTHRASLFLGATMPKLAVTALLSHENRGLVGPMGTHAADRARGLTTRLLVSASANPGGGAWRFRGAVHALDARYENPASVGSHTTSRSADVQVGRNLAGVGVRAGGGFDEVDGSALRAATRPRAFVAAARAVAWGRAGAWRASFAARGDALARTRGAPGEAALSPSIEVEHTGRADVFVRVGQGFRAPTFDDLFFSSPQWIDTARVLRPERVALDAEVGLRRTAHRLSFSASVYTRLTRDAIVWFPGNFAWSPRNVRRERVVGAEGRIAVATGPVVTEMWAGVRRTRDLTSEGLDVPTPYVPGIDGGALARFHRRALSLTATLRVIGPRPFVLVPEPTRATELPATALVDLAAGWRPPVLGRRILATVAVRNLGDVAWQSLIGYPAAGRSLSASVSITPAHFSNP